MSDLNQWHRDVPEYSKLEERNRAMGDDLREGRQVSPNQYSSVMQC